MRRDAITLGVLAVIVVSNLACLVLLIRARESGGPAPTASVPADRPASAGPSTPADARDSAGIAGRLNDIDARLAAMSNQIRALADRPGATAPAGRTDAAVAGSSSTAPTHAPDLAPAPGADTKMERMLQASQEVKKFWEDVGSLSQIRQGMEGAEYLDLLLEKTAGFLKLDPEKRRRFDETMRRKITDYDSMQAEQRKWYQRVFSANQSTDAADQKNMMEQYQAFNKRQREVNKQFVQDTKVGLAGILNEQEFTHKSFGAQLENWFQSASGGNAGMWWDESGD